MVEGGSLYDTRRSGGGGGDYSSALTLPRSIVGFVAFYRDRPISRVCQRRAGTRYPCLSERVGHG